MAVWFKAHKNKWLHAVIGQTHKWYKMLFLFTCFPSPFLPSHFYLLFDTTRQQQTSDSPCACVCARPGRAHVCVQLYRLRGDNNRDGWIMSFDHSNTTHTHKSTTTMLAFTSGVCVWAVCLKKCINKLKQTKLNLKKEEKKDKFPGVHLCTSVVEENTLVN